MLRTRLAGCTLLTLFSMALAAAGAASAQDATPAVDESLLAASGYPQLSIQVHDDRFELPEQVDAGRTLIAYENAGEESRHTFLLRLPEDLSAEEALASLEAATDAPPEWLLAAAFPGFPGETLPGQTSYAVVDLQPGVHLVLDDFVGSFEVVAGAEASPTPATEPATDGTVGLVEYGFKFSQPLAPGPQILAVTNNGEEPHELLLARSSEPVTVEQIVELLTNESEDENATPVGGGPSFADIEPIGGLGWISPGMTAWIEVDLEPGTYIALCFVFDEETGMPHVAMGMVDVFTIEDAATPAS